MAERSIEEIAAEDRREMYRLNDVSHVAHNVHNERPSADCDGSRSTRRAVRVAGRSAPGCTTDRTLCTFTLEDVAYQLVLPIDGEPVSGCLWDFENMMPEGIGRPRWDWFQEMFGELPDEPDADACTVTFSWLRSRLESGSCSLASLSAAHRRSRLIQLGSALLAWLYKSLCRAANRNVVQVAGLLDLLQSWIFWRFPLLRPYDFDHIEWPLASRWYRYLPTSDEKGQTAGFQEAAGFDALQRVRMSPVSDVGDRGGARSMHSAGGSQGPLFGGVQNRLHPALNINFLHSRDGRGSDQWFPHTYQRWHALWATRFEQLFEVIQSADPDPIADFIQWWILAARRYLVPADHFHHLPPDEIPVEATQRQLGPHPAQPDVPHVPDNRQPGRRMMVGKMTTARDWQWLEDIMVEDARVAPPTQKIRRMPESYARRKGAGRPRRCGRAGRGRGNGVTRRLRCRLRAVLAPVRR
ncbi:hypothetical protein PIB30_100341 [Stylosanthes scabra]|uniref:Aminotransferase-like plant mobile domain-containing protein n=1 Tax=Stylosanthes scabra TaxID=79078 RepID=A0ABU6WX15_9FABA|nr:hypothetical protein [Stylosanthes scabra]